MIDTAVTACRCDRRTLRPHEYWPWEYELQSRREGWILANDSDDCTTISRIDDPASVEPKLDFTEPKFDGDHSAQSWVIEQASQGSRLHMLAIYLMGFPVGQPLNMEPPECLLLPKMLAHNRHQGAAIDLPRLAEYHFDLGNSTNGPIGLAAMIYARDRDEALERLRSILRAHTMIQVYIGSSPTDPVQYVNVYVSPENMSSDSAEEIEDDMSRCPQSQQSARSC